MRRSIHIFGAVAASLAATAVGALADAGSADAATSAKSE
jgi:hypothetical protein